MTKTKIAIGAALLAGILAAPLLIQQQALATVRAEQSELQARLRDLPAQTVQPTAPLPGMIDIAARDRADLERLRLEAPALRAKIAEFSAQAQQLAASIPGHKPGGVPLGEVILLGGQPTDWDQSTPAATIRTLIPELLRGVTEMTKLMVFEDPAQAPTPTDNGHFWGQPFLQMRKEFVPDDMLTNMDDSELLLLEEQPGPYNDRWVLTQGIKPGTFQAPSRFLLRPTDTGWRLVIGTNELPVWEQITDQP